ncbi:hypothetical protein ACLOJK_022472 [Asimina triloba]
MRYSMVAAALLVDIAMVALAAAAAAAADIKETEIELKERHVFIQNKFVQGDVAVTCWLRKTRVWDRPRRLAPGKELILHPRDYDEASAAVYRCAVWTPYARKWCRFLAYDSYKHYQDCFGYGCRYQLRKDGIYYGVMMNLYTMKYVGGPYSKLQNWC